MKIQKDSVVTLRYKVADAATNRLIEEGKDPMVYLHGGYENIFPKVEAALDGQEKGFQATLSLSAEDAFGPRDESLVRIISKADFPPGVKVGGQLESRNDKGEPQLYTVTKIKGPQVILDGNHPLAGKALKFSATVIGVREATQEEISHRHVHGEHGHHH